MLFSFARIMRLYQNRNKNAARPEQARFEIRLSDRATLACLTCPAYSMMPTKQQNEAQDCDG